MSINNRNTARVLIGNRILLLQYADLMKVIEMDKEWTELRQEMTKALLPEDRMMMPGIKSASVVRTPEDQKLTDTPRVVVAIEGLDDQQYEWEATIQMADNDSGFALLGQIHMVSVPETSFSWEPALSKAKVS